MSVYSWTGSHLCDVDHNQLGLKNQDCLFAVGTISEGLIILAVGTTADYYPNSLQSYTVIYSSLWNSHRLEIVKKDWGYFYLTLG